MDKTLVDTALREAKEEVGIDSRDLDILCALPPFLSGWHQTTIVTPVIALLQCDVEDLEICENRLEVDHTLWVPLRLFIVSDHHSQLRGSMAWSAFIYQFI